MFTNVKADKDKGHFFLNKVFQQKRRDLRNVNNESVLLNQYF